MTHGKGFPSKRIRRVGCNAAVIRGGNRRGEDVLKELDFQNGKKKKKCGEKCGRPSVKPSTKRHSMGLGGRPAQRSFPRVKPRTKKQKRK